MIEDHRHCRICSKAIPLEESFCSESCENEWKKIVRRRRMMVYFMYGLIALFIILIFSGLL